MKEWKGTKGECHNNGLEIRSNSGLILANVYNHLEINQPKEEQEANAELIVDAFNTMNKCGIMPSELLEQRNDLLEALQEIRNAFRTAIKVNDEVCMTLALGRVIDESEEVISKCTGK